MIRNFKHRGLKRFYECGDGRGIRPDMVETVREILTLLDSAKSPRDLHLHGYRLHPLKGNLKGLWSRSVSADWRIIFRLDGTDVFDIELIDYHEVINTMPMKNPVHPGQIVRHGCLDALGLSVTGGAKVLGVTRQALNNVVNGKSGISAEMAIRLSKAFGSSPDMWLRMQLAYDLAAAMKDEAKIKVQRQKAPRELRP